MLNRDITSNNYEESSYVSKDIDEKVEGNTATKNQVTDLEGKIGEIERRRGEGGRGENNELVKKILEMQVLEALLQCQWEAKNIKIEIEKAKIEAKKAAIEAEKATTEISS